VSLPLASLHPLVDTVLSALQLALPAEASGAITRAFYSSAAAAGDSPADAWAALCAVLLRWAGVEERAPTPAAAASAWEALLRSEAHAQGAQRAQLRALGALPQPPAASLAPAAPAVAPLRRAEVQSALEALHAVYEDAKLDMLKARLHLRGCAPSARARLPDAACAARLCVPRQWPLLRPLAVLAARVAASVCAPAYVDYYERDWGALAARGDAQHALPPLLSAPPDVLRALAAQLLSGDAQHAALALPPLLSAQAPCCAWSVTVLRLYAALAAHGPAALPPLCASLHFGAAQLARLPHGVALLLHEALAAVRPSPPAGWPAAAYVLVGRPDLAQQCATPGGAPQPALPHALPLPDGDADQDGAAAGPAAAAAEDEPEDGMEEVSSFVGPLRFGRDKRLCEARRLLCSATPVPIRLGEGAEGGDPEHATASQTRLWALAARTCALPLGRGAFTLATSRPLPTEALPLPRLLLSGALPAAHNAVVALDLAAAGAPPDFLVWPDFHNGAAAGLRLAERGQAALTRTWVLYNRPAEPSASHAGMLLALGLAGHLAALAPGDLYRYLSAEHAPTTAALLLGMAASRRGSGHAAASRVLFLHVPARHPPGFPELELPPLVQAAAVAGVGLLYSGTGHRLMAEVLLTELAAAPGSVDAQPDSREGHALAAGLALGMVVLGHGRGAPQLADLGLETRLARLITHGPAPARAGTAGGAAATHGAGAAAGAAAGGMFSAADAAAAAAGGLPVRSGDASGALPGGGLVLEGAGVNLGVTSPGATLALGMLFLRTNDATAAARLAVPATHFALDAVRPDLLLLRVLARALILWDRVDGSEAWVEAQLPPLLRDALRPGAPPPPGAPRPPPAHRRAVDGEALAAAHVNVRAGACLALGLRYAGTAHAGAAATLRRHAALFADLKRRAPGLPGGVDKHTLETCVCCAALALGAVLAGTGNLAALRLLRRLRSRLDAHGGAAITYGSHMAVSMAIGFLFLGGGARTFSRAPAATAALLAAIVPPFPATTSDQRFHLQALRHLYVLAAEPRLLRAVDADSGAPCYAPIEMRVVAADGAAEEAEAEEHTLSTVAPCLAPEAERTRELRVLGPRHWGQVLRGERLRAALASGTLPVKRRTGCLPYAADPSGARSLLLRAFHLAAAAVPPPARAGGAGEDGGGSGARAGAAADATREQLVAAFSGEAHLLSFSERCAAAEGAPFYRAALHACLASAAGDALPAYLALHAAVAELRARAGSASAGGGGGGGGGAWSPRDAPPSLRLSTLKLCGALYEGALRRRALGEGAPALLQRTFVDACASLAAHTLESAAAHELPAYLAGAPPSRLLGAYLTHMGVPPRGALQAGLAHALGAAALAPEPTPLPPCVLRLLV
jgi:anaphase-promoting complex subunit 1